MCTYTTRVTVRLKRKEKKRKEKKNKIKKKWAGVAQSV
jgi:hypothetical protein